MRRSSLVQGERWRARGLRLAATAGLAALVVGGTSVPATAAGPGLGAVGGTITVPEGQSPSSVWVSGTSTGSGEWLSFSAMVDEDGSYLAQDVTPGTYVVEFATGSSDMVPEFYDDAASQTLASVVTVEADATSDVDASLELGATVEGRVTDADGLPVDGASVSVSDTSSTLGYRWTNTDENGEYHVGGLRAGSYRISVMAPWGSALADTYYGGTSWQTATTLPIAARAELTGMDVVMPKAAVVTGRLLRAGAPVDLGTVTFTSATDGSSTTTGTTTDGTFTKSLVPGTYIVRFDGPYNSGTTTQYWQGASTQAGATPLVLTSGQSTPLGDVTLIDGAAIAGTVTDAAGAPVAGASVWVTAPTGGSAQATTDATGSYRASGLTAGDYKVQFSGPSGSLLRSEYYDDAQQWMDADAVTSTGTGTVSGIDAELEIGGGVSGRVLDADGRPLPGAYVSASSRSGLSGVWMSASTDTDGNYSLGGLAAGDWTFQIQAPSGSTFATEWYLDATSGSDAEVVSIKAGVRTELDDVSLERGVTLTGRVVGPDGSPVRGASVSPRIGDSFPPSAVTGDDGTYTLRGLRPGAYELYVGAPLDGPLLSGYYPDGGIPEHPQKFTLTTTPVQTLPDTRLQRGGTVAGTITRPDGTPVRDASVWVELDDPRGSGSSTTTDEHGDYVATGVRAGNVTVSAVSVLNEEWGSDYAGINTFYAGSAGTPRRSLATRLPATSAGSLSDIDIALPPRGTAIADVAMSLSPASPVIGRPVTVTVQASGDAGIPTGAIDFWADGGATDAMLDAQGRATFTFTPDADTDPELHALYSGSAAYDEAWGTLVFTPGEPAPAPTVTSVSPTTASAVGGATVTLTGTGFDPSATVTVGGVPATDVVVESTTTLRATVPPHGVGEVPVIVTTAAGGASSAASLTYTTEPTTLALTTSAPSVTVGQPVTFTATVTSAAGAPTGAVTFVVDGGTPVSVPTVAGVAMYSPTGLTAGSHTVAASFAGGSTYGASSASVTQVVVPRGPTVSSVSPAVLTTAGGERVVTVTGADLTGATAVTFGDVPGTELQVVSATQVSVVAPAHAAGSVPVRVTTPVGTSTTSAPFLFVDVADGVVSQTPERAVSAPAVAPNSPVCVQITGTNGVPVGASGVVLNVTTVHPSHLGYVVVYPDTAGNGATPPPAGSSVNFEPGADVANAAFVQLPANGKVCYFTKSAGAVGVLLDVTGFTMPDAGIVTQASQRLVDTRPGAGHVGSVSGPVAPRTVKTVQVRGMAGVPEDASAVILNATVTGATQPGNLRVFPAGQDVPTASVVNFASGTDKANATIVDLPVSGKVSFYSDTTAPVNVSPVQVILDVTGYVVGGSTYSAVTPTRVLDTRPGTNHLGSIPGALKARTVYQVELPGTGGVPEDASAVVLNVTAIGPTSLGNLRVYPNAPGSTVPPTASTINYVPGRDIPNLVVVALPADGIVNLYSDMSPGGMVHVAADVVGYISGDAPTP
ncbi:carboxypeptidase regulatory-like domain-containing protein [Cellulomonas sp. Leaf334]|uniref:carboxypeptidase regulatory-like domain-containing protein n=1 Tax=Cellulomonas sp. Leaf334 TaxID=1736339 RepID=UPI0006F2E945|nr:carboxypeptidase regulatory-like domain-containing protein [Cellulomonas sp. Leaf334]KQR12076.1 hypothetical protein ASF78_12950 [Cellulomonas sp. Leaf334]